MSPFTARRRWLLVASFAATAILILYCKTGIRPWILPEAAPESHSELKGDSPEAAPESQNDRTLSAPVHSTSQPTAPTTSAKQPEITWDSLPQHYPVHSVVPLPSGKAERIPRIQHAFQGSDESKEAKDVRRERRDVVREEFRHAWLGYKEHAWLKDEVSPISGGSLNSFGGLAATLVDALDSLWVLGFHEDFEKAVKAVGQIDFSVSEETTFNVFEYTIRYLGGLLGAYEISERKFPILLEKATEAGEMLYGAFDTPNRMPITRWEWKKTAEGQRMKASENTLVAELGSLSLEFTTLSRLSKDNKYFDAIQRITDELQKAQSKTKLPGMWPVLVDASTPSFSGDNTFTLGAMSDSVYEYLPKQHLLLNGATSQYRQMYEGSLDPVKDQLIFRPMTKDNDDILLSGHARVDSSGNIEPEPIVQHLGCFAGGMLALGAKIMDNNGDLALARKLTDGCIWAYENTKAGVMPEVFHIVRCSDDPCQWEEQKWISGVADRLEDKESDSRSKQERAEAAIRDKRLAKSYTSIEDRRYILRPEAIESVFYLYRITGDPVLLDKAWTMFTAIQKISRTDIANAALDDVTVSDPPKSDRMESFWLAETLKYFYLIFSDPDVVSLDEWVFNTEAHAFRIWDR